MVYFEKLSELDKLYIAEKILKKKKIDLILEKYNITKKMEEIAKKHLEKNIPLSKIFREKYFWKDKFFTDFNTLDPRQESEKIIELILKNNLDKNRPLRILELGVGTGCLIISVLKEFPNATGLAIDISPKALKNAKINKRKILKDNRLTLKRSNWLDEISENFDILISNPPYLLKEEIVGNLKYDPYISLYIGENKLEKYLAIYNKIFLFNQIYLEINPILSGEILEIYKNRKIIKDDLGFDRFIV